MKPLFNFGIKWTLGILLSWLLLGNLALRAQQICHLVPCQPQTATVHNLQKGELVLDFALDALTRMGPMQIDSIALYFHSPDYCIKGGTIKLDTLTAEDQVKQLSIKPSTPCSNWWRISQKFGKKTKLCHFRRLILRGPELHPTQITLQAAELAPRLLIYVSYEGGPRPFAWLSQHGDASNSGRFGTFWGPASAAARPSQPYKKLIASGIAANTANILYNQGQLAYMAQSNGNYVMQQQSPFGGTPSTGPTINGSAGFETAQTLTGRQYLKNGSKIQVWKDNAWETLQNLQTGNANSFQTGPDGRIYVSDANLTAYSPFPEHRKLWTKGFGADNNKGCSLAATNAIGDLLYVYAWGKDSLYALDAATGIRRSAVKVAAATTPRIVVGIRGTVAYYCGSNITFFSSDLRSQIQRIDSTAAQPLSQPVCGSAEADLGSDEFLFLQGNQLMAASIKVSRDRYEAETLRTFATTPKYPITAIVADKSRHAYVIDRSNVFYSSFADQGWPTGLQVTQLIPGPDGSVYVLDKTQVGKADCELYALRFGDYGRNLDYVEADARNDVAHGNAVTLSSNKGEPIKGQHTLVAAQTLQIKENVSLSESADLTLMSGSTISFGKGFKVAQGATLKCYPGLK